MSKSWIQNLGQTSAFIALSIYICACGGKPTETMPAAESKAPESGAPAESAGADGEKSASIQATESGELSITSIRKEENGKYSATLNDAIIFKDLEIQENKLFFPKTPGQDGKEYHIVYLEDRSIAGQIKDAVKAGKATGKGVPEAIKVTAVKFFASERGDGKFKGFAQVTFNNAITVKGFKLIETTKGLWVPWPSVKKGEKDFDDLVFSKDKGVRDMVEAAVKKEAGM